MCPYCPYNKIEYDKKLVSPYLDSILKEIRLYKARFGKDTKHILYNAWGYDAVSLLGRALRRASGNTEKTAQYLYRMKGFKGASGPITFNAKGSSPRYARIFQVQGNRLVLIR